MEALPNVFALVQWDHVGDLIETVGQSDLGRGGIHLNQQLGGGFNHFLFSPKKPGEDVQF